MALSSPPANRLMTPRKLKVRWTEAAERKLINAYHDVMDRYKEGGRWVTRKAKEEIVMKEVNEHVRTELGYESTYNYDEIHNKIDTMKKKAKIFAVRYRVRSPAGAVTMRSGTESQLDADSIELDMDAAVMCWPNFELYWERFKYYPSMWQPCREDSNQHSQPGGEGPRSKDDVSETNSDCGLSCSGGSEAHDLPRSPNSASVCVSYRHPQQDESLAEHVVHVECGDEVSAADQANRTHTAHVADVELRYGDLHHVHSQAVPVTGDAHFAEVAAPRQVVPRLILHRPSPATRDSREENFSDQTERNIANDWLSASRKDSPPLRSATHSAHDQSDEERHVFARKRRHSDEDLVRAPPTRHHVPKAMYNHGNSVHYNHHRRGSDPANAHAYDRTWAGRSAHAYQNDVTYTPALHVVSQDIRSNSQDARLNSYSRGGSGDKMDFMAAFQKLLEETQSRQFEHDQQLQVQWTEALSHADHERRIFELRMDQERRAFEQKAEQERRAFNQQCERERDQLYIDLQKSIRENHSWLLQRLSQFLSELSQRIFTDTYGPATPR